MVSPRRIQRYGYCRDRLDRRDVMFNHFAVGAVPPAVDLSHICPPVMNQGQLGSCTAHGITGVLRAAMIKAGHPDRELSRLQLYYDEREIEGSVSSDAGAEIRDGIKTAAAKGVAPEPLWPYNVAAFTQKPFPNVYAAAVKFEALVYMRVGNADGTATAQAVKAALASGYPVVGGFNVYSQLESEQCAKDGIVSMPAPGEQPVGGHCVYLIGYGQKQGYFTARNSWGVDWGDHGNFYLPEHYVEQEGSDFWVVENVGKHS